ncbi:MAG: tetratricopeptide repeat protein [Chitinivibrionales bacterium]|nr:tetratricopeptide repeat protein [Chitinivibrionales bacterium]
MHLAEIREVQGRYRLAAHNLRKALAYNPGWGKAQKMLARMYEKDHQYFKAMDELQNYLQICDPEERDSIQTEIDRLVGLVHGGGKKKPPSALKPRSIRREPKVKPKEVKKEKKNEAAVTTSPPKTSITPKKQPTAGQKPVADKEFEKGVYLYKQGVDEGSEAEFDKALAHFRKAISIQPGHPGSYYYAGLIRRRKGQNEMARINFERALSYPELGYNAHFYLGKIYGEQKKPVQAVKHLRAYIAKTDYEPGKREARNLIAAYESVVRAAKVEVPRVDVEEIGREDIRREVSKIPPEKVPSPIELRIDSLFYMAVVDTLSDPGRAMLEGVTAFRDGNYDKAIETFKRVMVEYPKGTVAAQCIYNTGVCYMKLRDYGRAENQFSQILKRFSSNRLTKPALFLKALSYYERHEPTTAEKLFRRFISQYRSHEWVGKAYEKLGDCFVEMEQQKRAIDAYKQAVAQADAPLDKVHAFYKLGESYAAVDNHRRALDAYGEAVETGEKHDIFERVPESYYRTADYYYRNKEADKALEFYKRVTRLYPGYHDNAWGLFQIGNIYKKRGDYDKAVKTYKELMNDHEGEYWAEQAQWKLEDAVWEHQYRAVLR